MNLIEMPNGQWVNTDYVVYCYVKTGERIITGHTEEMEAYHHPEVILVTTNEEEVLVAGTYATDEEAAAALNRIARAIMSGESCN